MQLVKFNVLINHALLNSINVELITDVVFLNHIKELMDNVIHLHSQDSEKKVQIQLSYVKITNLLCVQMENVLEIKIIVELNYNVQINNIDVKIKHVNLAKTNVLKY